MNRLKLSSDITAEILDKGLGNSTWGMQYPEAYKALLRLREDVQGSAIKVLRRSFEEDMTKRGGK